MQAPVVFLSVLVGIYFMQYAIGQTTPPGTAVTLKSDICIKDTPCFNHSACNGGSCQPMAGAIPAWLGTCDCSGCWPSKQLKPCTSDADCGGLKTACSNVTKKCDCVGTGIRLAKAQNTTLAVVLRDFCNKQTCTNETNAQICNGLPCRTGKCNCLIKPPPK